MASSDPAVALEVPEEVEVDTRTGLTPRFSCATALVKVFVVTFCQVCSVRE